MGSVVSTEPTGFLYPFIDAEEHDVGALLADLAASASAKAVQSRAVRASTLEACAGQLHETGQAMAQRFGRGGRLFAFGNGGSATDAHAAVALFSNPPAGRPLPALSLVDDNAVLTALANDVGVSAIFSRQIMAHARPGDIAVGFSTSGGSRNVLSALEHAARRGLLTVGLSGYDGGAMGCSDAVHHCLIVRSDSVHRIQEAQSALLFALWEVVQECAAERSAP